MHVTNQCINYLSPLIQGESHPKFVNGIPEHAKLKLIPVPKILNKDFVIK
jgi:6-phosphofructokinase 1